MKKQKERSRAATGMETDDWVILKDSKESHFIGYDNLQAAVHILKYRKIKTKKEGEMYQLVLDQTPFYPEGGGQVGDSGFLESPEGQKVKVLDAKKENNLIVHYTDTIPNDPSKELQAEVDVHARKLTARNHSATHLLHQALRHILGTHVKQKGSAVYPKGLRFDFSHFGKMTQDEIRQVEDFVNARIQEALPIQEHRDIPILEAKEQGAMSLFGEKYGDKVRMIQFGESRELCGGTHVENSRDIWHFKIVSEGAIAAGIRRVEAITSEAAVAYYTDIDRQYEEVKTLLKNPTDPVAQVQKLQDEIAGLRKEVQHLQKAQAQNLSKEYIDEMTLINGVHFLAKKVDLDTPTIKDLLFDIGNEQENVLVVLANEQNGKATLSCFVSKNLVKEKDLHAGNIVRELAKHIQGGGGGQPFFATAGGKNPAGIPEALEAAKSYLA
jgi:alanyl-tRNA synthetase